MAFVDGSAIRFPRAATATAAAAREIARSGRVIHQIANAPRARVNIASAANPAPVSMRGPMMDFHSKRDYVHIAIGARNDD